MNNIRSIGIIMNGVTGRMGTNQHLLRSIGAIRSQGGLPLADGVRLLPEPVLVGRNPAKLRTLAEQCKIEMWSTDLDACLADATNEIYFDAQTTAARTASVKAALAAGKHVYCEKPLAASLAESLELARLAQAASVKNGIVQDKLFLPGFRKLKQVLRSGFLGRILSVRGEFGYWVFEGDLQAPQRPSWNYRKEDGGGIILDMFAHWQYLIADLFGELESVYCLGKTHIPKRADERGAWYDCTADDAAYAVMELKGGAVVQMNSSWAVRVNREDLLTIQVDGTEGSAVAGLRECKVQHRSTTPRAVWNPDVPSQIDYLESWQPVPDACVYENAFKVQWEMFLRHVAENAPFPHTFLEGAKGVQLAELAMRSSEERRPLSVDPLTLD